METIVVNGIVLCAAVFLVRWLYKNMVSRKDEPACGSCESCGPEEPAAKASASNAGVPPATSGD